jgi:hypothetical protein
MTRRIRRKDDWEDDGRTIVNMNIEGMPGYRRDLDANPSACAQETNRPKEMVSRRETWMIIFSGMKWAFLYSMGFVAILVLFILFCVKVWFA